MAIAVFDGFLLFFSRKPLRTYNNTKFRDEQRLPRSDRPTFIERL